MYAVEIAEKWRRDVPNIVLDRGGVGGFGAEVDEFEQGRHGQDCFLPGDGGAFMGGLADAGAWHGADPDMAEQAPGNVGKRFYKVGVE